MTIKLPVLHREAGYIYAVHARTGEHVGLGHFTSLPIAAAVVKTCNAHDELVSALQRVVEWGKTLNYSVDALDAARVTLAKLEG